MWDGQSGLDECVREKLRLGQAVTSSKVCLRGADHQGIATGVDIALREIPVIFADRVMNETGAAGP
jgi:hypothetical protein